MILVCIPVDREFTFNLKIFLKSPCSAPLTNWFVGLGVYQLVCLRWGFTDLNVKSGHAVWTPEILTNVSFYINPQLIYSNPGSQVVFLSEDVF